MSKAFDEWRSSLPIHPRWEVPNAQDAFSAGWNAAIEAAAKMLCERADKCSEAGAPAGKWLDAAEVVRSLADEVK